MYEVGDQVASRGDSRRVGIIRELGPRHADLQYYLVFWGGAEGSKMVPGTDLVPYEESTSATQSLVRGDLQGYQEFQRLITYHRVHREHPLRNNIYAFNASRTQLLPYQFKPLIKFLDSPRHRILICDEVGLGKTIEAGLILTELRAREHLKTVLVVCPAALRDKWSLELRRRFGEDFDILSKVSFEHFLDRYEESPERTELNGIVSYETLRAPSLLEKLSLLGPSLDLVIADEAHHMRNFGVKTRRAGQILSAGAGSVVLLTATPVHLGNGNLFSLLNLLDDEDFPDLATARVRFAQNEPIVLAQRLLGVVPPRIEEALSALEQAAASPWIAGSPLHSRTCDQLRCHKTVVANGGSIDPKDLVDLQRQLSDLNLLGHIFTRTRKRDVRTNSASRRATALEIHLTKRERAFYDAITQYVRDQAALSDDLPIVAQWRLNSIQRRAASSIHALASCYKHDLSLFGGASEDDDPPDEADVADLSEISTQVPEESLRELALSWPDNEHDSKYEQLTSLLRRLVAEQPHVKILLFAFYRETLKYLQGRLARDGVTTFMLHGGIPPAERSGVIDSFRNETEPSVLLSSRVGSEGLDFQFCDTLVNYDLPWNPMEVEQRIGRLDRIGQESPVIRIVNLWTLDTIEERILRKLYERIGIFEKAIGSIDDILGETMQQMERTLVSRTLRPEEVERELQRATVVLEQQIAEREQLEGDTAKFIGLDQYFEEEVASIQRKRRYVTGEQLRRFLTDFLHVHAPGARFQYDTETQEGRLGVDGNLRKVIQMADRAGDLTGLLAAGQSGIRVTFDADRAFSSPDIAFINVLHPLIGTIVDIYESTVVHRGSAQHVYLRTSTLSPGIYLYFVFRLTVRGAQPRNTLETVILDDALDAACDDDTVEALLGEMVERGEDPPAGVQSLDPGVAQLGADRALALFLSRQQVLREVLEEDNATFVDRRLASLRVSYGKNLSTTSTLLSKAEGEHKHDRYLRMLRGKIARLEGELSAKSQALESLRSIQLEHQEIAAGILEVVSP